jgi:hypothetical protein
MLFAVGSAATFLAHNAQEVRLSDTWAPVGVAIAIALALWGLARLALRDTVRASVLATLTTAFFFSAGVFVAALEWLSIGARPIVYAMFVLLLVGGLAALRRSGPPPLALFGVLRTMGFAFLLSSLAYAGYAAWQARPAPGASEDDDDRPAAIETDDLPDIYYLVLDGYGREDVLEAAAGFSNRPFVSGLESRGFYVAHLANSNYAVTQLSLASSLNMAYLDDAIADAGGTLQRPDLRPLVEDPEVADVLRDAGFTYVNVDSGWGFTSGSPSADVSLRPSQGRYVLVEFLRTTLLEYAADTFNQFDKRRHVLATFELLEDVEREEGRPLFVFSHVLMPHRPYVFGTEGETVSRERWGSMAGPGELAGLDPYIDQLVYTNSLVLDLMDELMDDRERPLVVVIQSDHGIRSRRPEEPDLADEEIVRERHAILNAFYFSEGLPASLHLSISPVNAFRAVLDETLETDYGLLEDRAYYSTHLLDADAPWGEIYEVTDVVTGVE